MKFAFPDRQVRPGGQRGAATLVVLILLFLMVAFIIGNSVVLSSLKRDLRMIERRQLEAYRATPTTNSLSAKPSARRR